MAAATKPRTGATEPVHGHVINQRDFSVAASTVIHAYTLFSFDAAGFAVPAADVAGQAGKAVYFALESADNSAGANGAVSVRGMIQGTANMDTGALTQANVGDVAHVLDDSTLATTSVNTRPIGTVLRWTATRTLVQIG